METPEREKEGAEGNFPSAGEVSWPAPVFAPGLTPPASDDYEAQFEQHLAEQAAATGTPIETLRKMEADAREKIGQTSPSREKLHSLAERTTPPAKYLEGDESCPF